MINFYHAPCCYLWEKILCKGSLIVWLWYDTSAFGAGTSAAMRQATSPKTILEYIINFLPVVSKVSENEAQYQELIDIYGRIH